MKRNLDQKEVDAVLNSLAALKRLRTVLDGLTALAEIRDEEDAGDWSAVVQVSDLVSRGIGDSVDNIVEALDVGYCVPETVEKSKGGLDD